MTTLRWNRGGGTFEFMDQISGFWRRGFSIKSAGSPTAAFVLATWFGLVTGLFELASIHARNHFSGRSSLSAMQISRHFPWMIPVANLMIFLTCGLLFGVLGKMYPRLTSRPNILFLCFLASLALFLTIPGLYTTACLALAAGFFGLVVALDTKTCQPLRAAGHHQPAVVGHDHGALGWVARKYGRG